MVRQLDERGKTCPIPVIEAKKAMEELADGDKAEVLVDNEIAVQNLGKMAAQKGYPMTHEKIQENCYLVTLLKTSEKSEQKSDAEENCACELMQDEEEASAAGRKNGLVVALTSQEMGQGDPVLGKALMKNFLYALNEQEQLPETILLYNGGAWLSCEGADTLEDLKHLAEQGVEIMTCGACLNHYGLTEKLAVGSITNMYQIVQVLTEAKKVVRP